MTAFDLPAAVSMTRVARGAMGAVWRLQVAGGTYAAKELFDVRPDPEALAIEVEFVDACRRAGVRCPRPIQDSAGGYAVRYPETGRLWRLYEWVDGTVPNHRDEPTVVWLAEQIGRIHGLGLEAGPGALPFYHRVDVDWPQVAADAAQVSWAANLAAMVDRLTTLSELVNATPVGEMLMCHRDVKATNVIADRSGGRWLVDWDNAGAMAPWREVGLLLMHHLADPDALARIGAAYRRSGGVELPVGVGLFATGLAVWLNFLDGQARAAIDPATGADHRRYAEEKVTGLLTVMPPVDRLERAAAGLTHLRG